MRTTFNTDFTSLKRDVKYINLQSSTVSMEELEVIKSKLNKFGFKLVSINGDGSGMWHTIYLGVQYVYPVSKGKYIKRTNAKAVKFFTEHNCNLVEGTVDHYLCCPSCGNPIATTEVFFVTGEYVYEMSNRAFHKLLLEQELLYHK